MALVIRLKRNNCKPAALALSKRPSCGLGVEKRPGGGAVLPRRALAAIAFDLARTQEVSLLIYS